MTEAKENQSTVPLVEKERQSLPRHHRSLLLKEQSVRCFSWWWCWNHRHALYC